MAYDQPSASRREQAITDMMARTGKTREQVEACMELVAHSMGWREPMTDSEFRVAFDTIVGTEEAQNV